MLMTWREQKKISHERAEELPQLLTRYKEGEQMSEDDKLTLYLLVSQFVYIGAARHHHRWEYARPGYRYRVAAIPDGSRGYDNPEQENHDKRVLWFFRFTLENRHKDAKWILYVWRRRTPCVEMCITLDSVGLNVKRPTVTKMIGAQRVKDYIELNKLVSEEADDNTTREKINGLAATEEKRARLYQDLEGLRRARTTVISQEAESLDRLYQTKGFDREGDRGNQRIPLRSLRLVSRGTREGWARLCRTDLLRSGETDTRLPETGLIRHCANVD